MWQFLEAAMSAIPSAATNGYALGAYALAIAAYVFTVWRVARNRNLLANLQKLPLKDRLSALEIEVGGVRLAKGITPEQWVRSRIHRYYLLAFIATCIVVIAIASLATYAGAGYVRTFTIINNQYQFARGGEPLTGEDRERVEELVKALVARDLPSAQASFVGLSQPARQAYERAYSSAPGGDMLVPPERLTAAMPVRAPNPSPSPSTSPAFVSAPRPAAGGREAEPNNDILTPNEIPLNATITAAIEGATDTDFYTFTSPARRRDYIDIVINNDSTTLAPTVTVYNPDKGVLDYRSNGTPGGDVSYAFVAQPENRYFVSVSPNKGHGSYRLTIRPRNAFDQYEPNDDILSATAIDIGKTIEPNVMDPGDVDYYRFETRDNAKLVVFLENRSTTLAPTISVFRADKSLLDYRSNGTPGGDVSYTFAVQPNNRFYISVSSNKGSGKYALTVRPE